MKLTTCHVSPRMLANTMSKVSAATLCTALFKRGFRNVYIQGISRLTTPSGGNLVGPAFTMRSIPAREVLISSRARKSSSDISPLIK